MKKLTKFIAVVLSLVMILSVTACGGSNDGTTPADGGATKSADEGTKAPAQPETTTAAPESDWSDKDTIVLVSAYTDPGNFSTYSQATAQASVVTANIMEGLVRFYEGAYIPNLAESFEWVDEKTLEVKIRKDVKFHNGDPMTVDDVIFSNELSRTATQSAGGWVMVDNIEKIDDTTIHYNLKYADIDFIQALSGSITSKSYYESVGEQGFGLHPVGTGCFAWEDYQTGDHVTLKFFEDYWGTHGTINTLTIRFISEVSQALIDLENGVVDIITANGSTIAAVQGNKDIKLEYALNGLHEYCGFNFNSERVQDLKVRQALAYAIDREDIVIAARDGIGTASYGLVPTNFEPEYNPEVETWYNTSTEKAAELLGELGYSTSNPYPLTLMTDTSPARKMEAEQVKNAAEKAGFAITISSFESATVTSILAGGKAEDYDLFIRALGQQTSTTYQMGTIFSVAATEAGNNPFWFTRETPVGMDKFDDLFKEIRQTTDDAARYEKMKQLQIMEREMVLACWLVEQQTVTAMNAKLMGYYISSAPIRLNDAYFVK